MRALPVRLDVADLDGDGLGDPQAGAIGGDEGGTVLEVGRHQDQALDLLFRHGSRQLGGQLSIAQPGHALGTSQCLDVQETERGERGVGRGRAETPVDQCENEVAHLPGVECGRRSPVVLGHPLDLEEVGSLCARGQIGDAHSVDHPLARRATLRPVDRFPGHHFSFDHDDAPPDRSDGGLSKESMPNREHRETVETSYTPAKSAGPQSGDTRSTRAKCAKRLRSVAVKSARNLQPRIPAKFLSLCEVLMEAPGRLVFD